MTTKVIIERDGKGYELTYDELLLAHQVFENRMVFDKLIDALVARMSEEKNKEITSVINAIGNLSEAVEKAIENDIDTYLDSYIYEYQMKYDTSLDAAVEWFAEESGKYREILDKVLANTKQAKA